MSKIYPARAACCASCARNQEEPVRKWARPTTSRKTMAVGIHRSKLPSVCATIGRIPLSESVQTHHPPLSYGPLVQQSACFHIEQLPAACWYSSSRPPLDIISHLAPTARPALDPARRSVLIMVSCWLRTRCSSLARLFTSAATLRNSGGIRLKNIACTHVYARMRFSSCGDPLVTSD